ncbi:MAG: hypothetical protein EOP34_09680 [Rickettsiales bacterium]|nr:MAG: hypothetical protein EOP34_09680 [Rickettsiales bacterium]
MPAEPNFQPLKDFFYLTLGYYTVGCIFKGVFILVLSDKFDEKFNKLNIELYYSKHIINMIISWIRNIFVIQTTRYFGYEKDIITTFDATYLIYALYTMFIYTYMCYTKVMTKKTTKETRIAEKKTKFMRDLKTVAILEYNYICLLALLACYHKNPILFLVIVVMIPLMYESKYIK